MNIALEDAIKLSLHSTSSTLDNVHVDKGHMFIFSYCDSY